MRVALAVAAACALTGGAACGGGAGRAASPSPPLVSSPPVAASPSPSARATATATSAPSGFPGIRADRIASLDQPLALAVRPDDPALYVAEKTGLVVAITGAGGEARTVLDLSQDVSQGGEQGLLGLAFSPDGRFAYVNYTDLAGDTHVTEFAWRNGRANVATRRDVLFIRQPFANHNGGNLGFGPDGDLYVGMGDGGSEGDPRNYSQSLSTLLGKMLRIHPRPAGGLSYGVPKDNPFVGRTGARPEIWAYGLRNPWRWSFDRDAGDLWIGDVGGGLFEEVDLQRAGSTGGQNYGWNRLEGTRPQFGSRPPGAVPPVYEYSHGGGRCVITGGYVYRGAAIRGLAGAYLFADYCVGRIMGLRMIGGTARVRPLGPTVPGIASFGQDRSGELYALSLEGGVFRLGPAS